MYDGGDAMTPSERARLFRMIRDEHELAKFELRAARNNMFHAGINTMRQTLDALQSANNAQRRAIDHAIVASKLALRLFVEEDPPQ